jgi:hypothetical protein
MNQQQSNTLEWLKEIQKFLDERAAELPGLSATGMRKKFDDTVEEVAKLAATQTSADLRAMSTTQRIRGLTTALIDHHMTHVARVAKVALPPGPELVPLGVPKRAVTGERLAARARGMATEAQKYESTFVQAGLPSDFIQQLRDAADALTGLIGQRKQSAAERGAATKLLTTEIKEAKKVVQVLDAFVKTTGKNNAKVLVTWKIVRKRRQQASTPTPANEQEAIATPTGAAA